MWVLPKLLASASSSLFLLLLLILSPRLSQGDYIEGFFDVIRLITTPSSSSSDSRTKSQNIRQYSPSVSDQPQNLTAAEIGPIGQKCFEDLGCVENTVDWVHSMYRPINLFPEDRKVVNTRFAFFNRNHGNNSVPVILNATQLTSAGFDPKKPVKVIVHGFLDSGISLWATQLAQALLLAGDFNVFVVDWSVGALNIYGEATANTRLVGLEIAYLFTLIQKEFKVKLEDGHCIGHSLGAHCCGYAGEKLNGTLGRITGLDPAGPYFQYLPPKVSLDPTDAIFVDNIHTDGSPNLIAGFGFMEPCGHVDFYPNDGHDQPGCEITKLPANIFHSSGFDEAKRELAACNHHRAVYYFIESILNPNNCKFVGHICEDYQKYLDGDCYSCGEDGWKCAIMGLDADKFKVKGRSLFKFYLSTADERPFCLRHYHLSLNLARTQFPDKADDWIRGQLNINLVGAKATLKDIQLEPVIDEKYNADKNLTFIIPSSKDVGQIEEVQLGWKSTAGIFTEVARMPSCIWTLGCNNKIFIKNIEVLDMDVMDIAIGATRNPSSLTLCGGNGANYTGINMGSVESFKKPC